VVARRIAATIAGLPAQRLGQEVRHSGVAALFDVVGKRVLTSSGNAFAVSAMIGSASKHTMASSSASIFSGQPSAVLPPRCGHLRGMRRPPPLTVPAISLI
jgi:hypothetical protein